MSVKSWVGGLVVVFGIGAGANALLSADTPDRCFHGADDKLYTEQDGRADLAHSSWTANTAKTECYRNDGGGNYTIIPYEPSL